MSITTQENIVDCIQCGKKGEALERESPWDPYDFFGKNGLCDKCNLYAHCPGCGKFRRDLGNKPCEHCGDTKQWEEEVYNKFVIGGKKC